MFGYRVYHQFDRVSYLISRSCFYKEIDENSEDETEKNDYRPPSEYSFESFKKNIAGTDQFSSNDFASNNQNTFPYDSLK